MPGTKFYEQVKAQLGPKTHWQDSDDLTMMFRGAYHSDFYRRVRDLLHEQIILQTARSAAAPAARAALAAKWMELVATEREYRSEDNAAQDPSSPILTGPLHHAAISQNP